MATQRMDDSRSIAARSHLCEDGRNDEPPSPGGRALPAYGQTQVSREDRKRARGEFPTCWVKNPFLSSRAAQDKRRALHPALEKGRQLAEIVDRGVGFDVDRLLRRADQWAAPDRAHAKPLGAPYVLHHPVSHHDRIRGRHTGELKRAPKDRLMWLLPPHTVRTDHMVDGVGQSEAAHVLPHLFVATPERVRDEPDDQPATLRPAERVGGPGDELSHEIERHAAGGSKPIDGHVVKPVAAVHEPVLDPAIRLLPVSLGALCRAELRADEGVVPVALAEFTNESLARQLVDALARRPSLDEGVADVQEHGTKGHASIVSTLHARLRTARIHREVAATGVARNSRPTRPHSRWRAFDDARW